MLDAGELDALISPIRPRSLAEGQGLARRMFTDHREVEKDYYRRTGAFHFQRNRVLQPGTAGTQEIAMTDSMVATPQEDTL